jgi:hypothetical protein
MRLVGKDAYRSVCGSIPAKQQVAASPPRNCMIMHGPEFRA